MPLVDLLTALLWSGQNGLPPTPDTLHLGCSYHLHSSHRFLSTWDAVMLEKITPQVERKNNNNNKVSPSLQKQTGCFNHRVVTLVADKLWLCMRVLLWY